MYVVTVKNHPPGEADTIPDACRVLGELLRAHHDPAASRERWQIEDEDGLVMFGDVGLGYPDYPEYLERVDSLISDVVRDVHVTLATQHIP